MFLCEAQKHKNNKFSLFIRMVNPYSKSLVFYPLV